MAPDGMGRLEKLPSPLVLPLHQLDLPLTVSFSHLRVIFPPLPAEGKQPSSHKESCQIFSAAFAHPRLGKSGPK